MWRLLSVAPFLLVLVLFALSNRQDVTLGFWPTDLAVTLPLSLAILMAMAVAFLAGALVVWVPSLGVRLRARRLAREARTLQARLASRENVAAQSPAAVPPNAVTVR